MVRFSATDYVEGGWDQQQTNQVARWASELGADLFDISSGGIVAGVKIPIGPGYQVPAAVRIRAETGVVTRAVGLITSARQANTIIADGQADQVALARAILDDPRWGWHAADALGAEVHCPPQYARARPGSWRSVRDGNA